MTSNFFSQTCQFFDILCQNFVNSSIKGINQTRSTAYSATVVMGIMFSFLAKAGASSALSGLAASHILSPEMLPPPLHTLATVLASMAGLLYYIKVWIHEYYIDWSYSDNSDLTGRTAVVTGGTVNGLGFATAEILYEQGAKVIITVRTKEKGEAAITKLKGQTSIDDGRASYVLCDFVSEASVRNCAAEIRSKASSGIDFLVLNAGISGRYVSKAGDTMLKNDPHAEAKMKNKFTALVWMINYIGPWIFAKELMPLLVKTAKRKPSDHPRVVWVSSGAHKRASIHWEDPFHPDQARAGLVSSYGQSKLGNLMHAREYQKRVRELLREESRDDKGSEKMDVKCFAITPGLVWTNFIPKFRLLYPLFWFLMRSPRMGAQVIKMACLANDLKGGEYLSNCYVKESEGIDGCSKDEEQWQRLWELTAKHVEEKEHEKYIEIPNVDKKAN